MPTTSIPHSLMPTTASSKDEYRAKDNKQCDLLTKSDDTDNRRNDTHKNVAASNFRQKVMDTNNTNKINTLPEAFHNNETNGNKYKRNTSDSKGINVGSVPKEYNKSINNILSTEQSALTKRYHKSLAVMDSESDRNSKIELKTGMTRKIKIKLPSEKPAKCRSDIRLKQSRNIVLNKSSPEAMSCGNEAERKRRRRRNDVRVGQKLINSKEGYSPLELIKKYLAAENVRKMIVQKGSSELNITRGTQCSDGGSLRFASVKRKEPDEDNFVPEKKFRTISPEPLIGLTPCNENLATVASIKTSKECIDISTCYDRKPEQHVGNLKMFNRKEAPYNVITANKDPHQAQISKTLSSVSQRTTVTSHVENKPTISNKGVLSADPADNQAQKSTTFNHLFAGCCMTYLKTSKCNLPCSLSHEVNIANIFGDVNAQSLMDVLQTFLSEAVHPPLNLIQDACNTFAAYKTILGILSISNIFTRQSARSDSVYMPSILKFLIQALREFYGDNESSLALIVKYLCTVVAQMDSKQQILDKIITMIEETVELDNKWSIYSNLATVEDYVWPERLLIDLFREFMNKNSTALSKDWLEVKKYTAVLLKESHNKHLFSIWKRFPKLLNRLYFYYLKFEEPSKTEVLKRKLNLFCSLPHAKKASGLLQQDQRTQVSNKDSRETVSSNTGIAELQNMEEHPGTSPPSFTGTSRINVSFRRQQVSLSNLEQVDFNEDANSLQNFLDVNNYCHVLNTLDKWQNTQYFSTLAEYLFLSLRDVKKNKGCAAYYNNSHGLLTAAIDSGDLSADMKTSLHSISVSVILDMVVTELWVYAYQILEMARKHELICFSCEVYAIDKYSPARRNITFAKIYSANGNLEEAVTLLIEQNMLAKNRQEWKLKNVDGDMAICNSLIQSLITKSIKFKYFNLSYRVLMYLVKAQRGIRNPIDLIRPYQSLLRKLLEKTDSLSMGLKLFKTVCSYHTEPAVFDQILCRMLVVIFFNKKEIALSKMLIKRGYLIGAYRSDTPMFKIKIISHWTRAEVMLIIDEAIYNIWQHALKRSTGSTISMATIDTDLILTVMEEDDGKLDFPELLTHCIDNSLTGATLRLKSVLRSEYYPPLYNTDEEESGSPHIVVEKSVLYNYISLLESTLRA